MCLSRGYIILFAMKETNLCQSPDQYAVTVVTWPRCRPTFQKVVYDRRFHISGELRERELRNSLPGHSRVVHLNQEAWGFIVMPVGALGTTWRFHLDRLDIPSLSLVLAEHCVLSYETSLLRVGLALAVGQDEQHLSYQWCVRCMGTHSRPTIKAADLLVVSRADMFGFRV